MRARTRRGKTWTSVGQLVIGVASLVFVFFQYLKGGATNDPILLAVFFLFATTILIDRIGQVFTNYSTERDEDDLRDLIDRLPGNLIGRNDIVAFPNDAEASAYCTAMVPFAISVKNTVLRYEHAKRGVEDNSDYTEWRKEKVASIKSNRCSWTEIISNDIDRNDYQREIVSKFSKIGRSKYNWRFLDEELHPMIQMAIFEFENGGKEIIFGWQFPGVPQGPCFVSKNDRLVLFFESYFMYYFNKLSASESESLADKANSGSISHNNQTHSSG